MANEHFSFHHQTLPPTHDPLGVAEIWEDPAAFPLSHCPQTYWVQLEHGTVDELNSLSRVRRITFPIVR